MREQNRAARRSPGSVVWAELPNAADVERETYYSTSSLAERTSLSERELTELMEKGEIPGVNVGEFWVSTQSAVAQYLTVSPREGVARKQPDRRRGR